MTQQFNLEEEFGWVLDGIEKYIDENPDDFLEHNGVKGMKWGSRKSKSDRPELKGLGPDKIVRKTKYGEEMTLTKDRPTALHKALGRISKKYSETYEQGAFLTIRDSNGKKVGDASVEKKNADELYLNWLGVDKSARGKGYASAVMKASTEFGKEAGFKKLTLEVPGNAPDALHIYTKLGFKKTGKESGGDGDIWGGLTSMEYVFADVKHQQTLESFEHNGVLGMKWGKRGSRSSQETTAAPKPKMTKGKKVAIAVGVGALAAGAGIAVVSLSKNGKIPMSKLVTRPEFKKGQEAFQPSPKPSTRPEPSTKPKAPSAYPMTPLVPTPILDEIMKKYKF